MQLFSRALLLSCIAAAAASGASAAGVVTVSFTDPPHFSDAGATPWEKEATLRALTAHLQALGERYLSAGQALKVEVLDVDLAGTMRPARRAGRDLRVVKGGADWPRIDLRYALEASGQPAISGQESVADMNYSRGVAGDRGADPLHYEKHMLDVWFKARFVERRAAGD
jgi:hypothetical protein